MFLKLDILSCARRDGAAIEGIQAIRHDFVGDSVLIVLDDRGCPQWDRLAERHAQRFPDALKRAAAADPVAIFTFDPVSLLRGTHDTLAGIKTDIGVERDRQRDRANPCDSHCSLMPRLPDARSSTGRLRRCQRAHCLAQFDDRARMRRGACGRR